MNKKIQYIILIIIAAVIIGLLILNRIMEKTYPIDYSIQEPNVVNTVYFKAELYKQGDIECWMMFGEDGSKPSHLYLYSSVFPQCRVINNPEGCFGYNTVTNRYIINLRDERQKEWYPDFLNFFNNSVIRAEKNRDVQITDKIDPETNSEMIVVTVTGKDNVIEYWIDKKSKWLVRFHTIEIKNFMNLFKKTIAVRNMSAIVYNESLPDGIFEIPEDAEQVNDEHDLIIHPGIGMPVYGLTHQQACEKIVKQVENYLNARDWDNVSKLLFPFFEPPKEMLTTIPAWPGAKLTDIIATGKAYTKNGYWYLPVKSKEFQGKTKNEKIPIKFYAFDGNQYCMIMWPD